MNLMLELKKELEQGFIDLIKLNNLANKLNDKDLIKIANGN